MQLLRAIVAITQMLLASSAMTAFPSRCGKQNEMVECGAENPLGTCCSEFGYCGKTDGHCKPSMGCQSGCTADEMPGYTDSNRCGSANNQLKCNPKGKFGGCCSNLGFCGKDKEHCLPSNGCVSGCDVEDPKYSDSDRCGSANKGLLCNPNKGFGICCSESGYCGTTEAYCLPINGCQSGCTVKSTSVASPTSTASSTIASSSTSNTATPSSASSTAASSSASASESSASSSASVSKSSTSSSVSVSESSVSSSASISESSASSSASVSEPSASSSASVSEPSASSFASVSESSTSSSASVSESSIALSKSALSL